MRESCRDLFILYFKQLLAPFYTHLFKKMRLVGSHNITFLTLWGLSHHTWWPELCRQKVIILNHIKTFYKQRMRVSVQVGVITDDDSHLRGGGNSHQIASEPPWNRVTPRSGSPLLPTQTAAESVQILWSFLTVYNSIFNFTLMGQCRVETNVPKTSEVFAKWRCLSFWRRLQTLSGLCWNHSWHTTQSSNHKL